MKLSNHRSFCPAAGMAIGLALSAAHCQNFGLMDKLENPGSSSQAGDGSASAPVYCGGQPCRIYTAWDGGNLYAGNLGGVTGADAKCNSDVAKPSVGTYQALLVDTAETRRACVNANCAGAAGIEQSINWVLHPNTVYVQTNGVTVIGTTNSNAIFTNFPLVNKIDPGNSLFRAWTGLGNGWLKSGNNCSDWTVGTSLPNGDTGNILGTDYFSFSEAANLCSNGQILYCVQQ